MAPTLGVAIPCFKGHLPHLQRLLATIESQTRRPEEVVVSCSSMAATDVRPVFPEYSFRFRIFYHPERMNASQNRNFAVSQLTTEYISFIDADDMMHIQRIAALEEAIIGGADFIVHGYTNKISDLTVPISDIKIQYKCLKKDPNPSSMGIIAETSFDAPIHHGHSTCHRSIVEKSPFPIHLRCGEDSTFCVNALAVASNPTYICASLSLYAPTNSWMHAPGR